jgi:ubiquinone/menaquinone biosynthesis C-methylase UbiE
VTDETYRLSAQAAEFYESTFVPALFRDWARQLVAFAGPAPGQRVLDVACGTGVVARELATKLDPADITGLDVNPAMLEVARRLAPQISWQEGDASALPFADGSFDLVVSQAALMFFPDRVAALREMGRLSTGEVVVQVPGRMSHSPGYTALARILQRHVGDRAVDLLGAIFAVGEPAQLRELFTAAGLAVERFETWTGATRLPSVEEFLSVELLPIADDVQPDVRERLAADAAIELAPFIDSQQAIAAPIEVHLVAGRASGGAR